MPTKKNNNKYVSMKDYVDNRFDASQAAIEIASTAATARLDSMNEWRSTYGDQQKGFPTRLEINGSLSEIKTILSDAQRDNREQSKAMSAMQAEVATLHSRLGALSIALAGLGLVAGVMIPVLITKLM